MKSILKKVVWLVLVALVLAAFGCKTDTETKIEYVDKKADETAPASVTELTATPKDSRILLTWQDAADRDVYGYEVSYSGTKPINRVVLPTLDTTSMMVSPKAGGTYINGLTNGTEYTFTVKTVDTSGNKSEGVTVKGTPVAIDAGETLKIALTASVPQKNGYTGNKSNTKVTVTAKITTASNVKKVVWKKDGSLIAKTLLADKNAAAATETEDNAVWTFDITAQHESANGSYTVAAIDETGREESEQITIDNFDFTPPAKVDVTSSVYSSESSSIIINWTEPVDTDYHHVDITYTTNDGKIINSEPSQTITVNKGTLNKTFGDIDGEKAYYTYTFVTYDELGNKGAEYKRKVSVNPSVEVDCRVGDFILKDGTILSKDETPESDTVAAVIVRAATDDKPALGVGIVHMDKASWCTSYAAGYNKNITALQGDQTSGYMDGSDGWEILKKACSDAENNPENYPAWNYSLTYAETNGLTGALATGWYLPTVAELYTIYQNKAVVDASLSKANGRKFGTKYVSCCQVSSFDYCVWMQIFGGSGSQDTYRKNYRTSNVCSVRAFN